MGRQNQVKQARRVRGKTLAEALDSCRIGSDEYQAGWQVVRRNRDDADRGRVEVKRS